MMAMSFKIIVPRKALLVRTEIEMLRSVFTTADFRAVDSDDKIFKVRRHFFIYLFHQDMTHK